MTQAEIKQVCEKCGKPVGKAGSMTQWIFDPSKCSCSGSDAKPQNVEKTCTLCGNPLGRAEGSITQWIFKPRVCTCLVVDQQIVSDGVELPPDDSIYNGDRYHFLGVAGHGGAGTVFKAKDIKLGRAVAIKVIQASPVGDNACDNAGADSSQLAEHFEMEAKAASKLQHPNVVTVQDFGTLKDGRLFLVTEWIEGITLAQYLSRHGTLSVEATTEVFCQVLDALSHAHNRGVVHRDIKPNNIMLGRTASGEWTVKVIDFGTAREVDKDINATSVDNIAGSPFYMSPEQAGGNVDHRSDLYSVGCSLFEALVGKPPFTGHPLSVVMRHQTEPPPHLSIAAGRRYPSYLEQWVAKSLEKQPDDRFQSADDMKQSLVERSSHKATSPRPVVPRWKPSRLIVGGAIVCVVATAGILMTMSPRSGKAIEDTKVGKSLRLDEEIWDMSQVGGGRYFINYDERQSRPVEPTASGIRRLAKYKVTRMDLLNSSADDDAMKELGGLPNLMSLNITNTEITEKTFLSLVPKLKDLIVIRAEGTSLTDASAKALAGSPQLRVLDLNSCKISASAFDDVQSFPPGLSIIGLSKTGANDHTVERISKLCPNITQLELKDTSITDASIPHIIKWKNMNTLYISNTKITDKGAKQLQVLTNLRALSLESPAVSKETLKFLEQRLTRCRMLNADAIAEIDL